MVAFYRLADICIVSSLHDGMNLIAKEYVAAREGVGGILMLSQFAGASRELHEALIINPYDIDGFADSIKQALEMPKEERQRRMAALRATVRENNIYKWAGKFIMEIDRIKR
jgi:trehalose 6-phosphate synthase